MDGLIPVGIVTKEPWVLKELSPKHKQVIALLVQGVSRSMIAEVCDITPEYVTMLSNQPLCRAYFTSLEQFADLRLVALAEKRSDVISTVMDSGSDENKLKAAKLQLEATGHIGRFKEAPVEGGENRLEMLAERLVSLLQSTRKSILINGDATHVEDSQAA